MKRNDVYYFSQKYKLPENTITAELIPLFHAIDCVEETTRNEIKQLNQINYHGIAPIIQHRYTRYMIQAFVATCIIAVIACSTAYIGSVIKQKPLVPNGITNDTTVFLPKAYYKVVDGGIVFKK